jgi:hypothetical protein
MDENAAGLPESRRSAKAGIDRLRYSLRRFSYGRQGTLARRI